MFTALTTKYVAYLKGVIWVYYNLLKTFLKVVRISLFLGYSY